MRPYYSPGPDRIQLPPRAAFKRAEDYYATALHELIHHTAHPTRLARPLHPKGHPGYALEELIAELGSAFLCAHCRLDGELHHPEYVSHWLEALRADKRAIFTAVGPGTEGGGLSAEARARLRGRCAAGWDGR